MGHTAVFLIGDFSAMIGDPTGQSETRPPLTREQVDANAKTYLAQVYKILDREKTEVRYNSEWLGKMLATDVVRLCSHYRLARMLEREDFRSRLQNNHPISVHELLYPLLTAYDAVSLKSDVELGATEQKFNLLVHREIQREYGLPGQAILTMPILVGLDGQRKMSKSLGNYIGITEPPAQMFRKIMSIPDILMWSYYELVTDFTATKIAEIKAEVENGVMPPLLAKKALAVEVVKTFYGEPAGIAEADEWSRVFSERKMPSVMSEVSVSCTRVVEGWHVVWLDSTNVVWSWISPSRPGPIKWSHALAGIKQGASASEAERIIKQKGFEVNGQLVTDPSTKLDLTAPASYEIRFGKKKFLRLIVE